MGAGTGPGPGPSYPIVSRSTPCLLGYTLGVDGTCVGKFCLMVLYISASYNLVDNGGVG